MNKVPILSKSLVSSSFSRFAGTYTKHAFVQKEIETRLLERCLIQGKEPKLILDLGSGPGCSFKALRQQFPGSKIVSLDLSWGMVKEAQKGFLKNILNQSSVVQGDMESLPFAANTFDMVFSNCALQWCNDTNKVFDQVRELLKPEGTFFFSTFGPDTLIELKDLFKHIDDKPHAHDFTDMHFYGDSLLQSGLARPVVSGEKLNITYQQLKQLLDDLKYTGASNLNPNRHKGLTPSSHFKKLHKAFDRNLNKDGAFHCTWEVIYGHAIKPNHTFAIKPQPLHLVK